jgi:hypothetical protein
MRMSPLTSEYPPSLAGSPSLADRYPTCLEGAHFVYVDETEPSQLGPDEVPGLLPEQLAVIHRISDALSTSLNIRPVAYPAEAFARPSCVPDELPQAFIRSRNKAVIQFALAQLQAQQGART